MRIHPMVRVTIMAGILAPLVASVAGRLMAQSPRDVTIHPAVRERPIEIDRGAAALWQSLLKLHTRASMIMIDAHPDDEDGGLLAYESRGKGARVALLTLNRGEAGQNLMNSDYFDAMGLLRTEELLAADHYYGVQQYFTRVIDFGFSKSKEESFQKWKKGHLFYDIVRVVRTVRPLVVTSVFVGSPSDGHGNHRVAGQLSQEVFKAAGDPNIFPEQIRQGLRPWTPLKMYARVPTFAVRGNHIWDYANGRTYPLRFYNYISDKWIEGLLPVNLVVPEGEYDPLLGGTFEQIGRQGLSHQKSQNGGIATPPPGPANSAYHLFGSRVPTSPHETSMFAGIDVSLMGIADLARGQNDAFLKAGLRKINGYVEQAMKQFGAQRPDKIAPILAEGAKANLALIGQVVSSSLSASAKYNVLFELRVKQAQFNTALAEALGLSVRSDVTPPPEPNEPVAPFHFRGPADTMRTVTPGQTFYVRVRAADVGRLPVTIRRVWVETPEDEHWTSRPDSNEPTRLAAGQITAREFEVQVPEDAAYTRPYFSRNNIEQAYYDINDPKYLNLPFAPYPVSGWAEFEYRGVPVRVGQVVQTFKHQRGLGQVADPLVVAPALSLWISPRGGVVPVGAKSFPVSVLVHSNVKGPAQGTLRLDLPAGWNSTPESAPFSFARDGQAASLQFEVQPSSVQAKTYRLQAVAHYNGREYREGYETVGYPGLRPYYLYRSATYKANGADVKIAPGLKVAYVVGTGGDVSQSLVDLGVHTTFLNSQDIATGNLSKYNAIILGIRAYSARPDLATYNQRLLNYVHRGGVLIVQYQDRSFDHNFAPYPFHLGRAQTVTQEHCKVKFLEPNNPALLWPNRIGPADFRSWIEERGHGYPESWGPQWQAPFEMHDKLQAPQKGGLLIAPYGKGEYVYLALALYRQLPEGVPGAYRIFANLLSLGRNPQIQPNSNGRSRR